MTNLDLEQIKAQAAKERMSVNLALVAEIERLQKRIEALEIGVREIAIMHQDDRPGIGEPAGHFDWRLRSEAQERVARSLLVVRPPAVRVPTPEEIASMTPEQAAAETARLKRETGAVGGISRCGTTARTPEEIARQAIEDYLAGRRDSKGNPRSPASSRCRECDGSRKLGGWADIRDIPCPLCWGKS